MNNYKKKYLKYKKKYLKYKKKYLETKKMNGGSKNMISSFFNNMFCNNYEFSKNLTEYRVVFNNVYFYNNVNGTMVKNNEIAELDGVWTGTIILIDDNIYVDLGMNEYIPVFDRETGDILVTTQNKKCLSMSKKKNNCNERSSTPIAWIKLQGNSNTHPIQYIDK